MGSGQHVLSSLFSENQQPDLEAENRELRKRIKVLEMEREIHRESRGTYGSPRVHAELQQRGFEIGRNRVARLMADQGLVGLRPRAFRRTTDSRHAKPIAPNLVAQHFDVEHSNEL